MNSVIQLIDSIKEDDLDIRPTSSKFSIGELLNHFSTICEADVRILNGASQKEMIDFYDRAQIKNFQAIKHEIRNSYELLKDYYENLNEDELLVETTSYWGITYTKYEWLLEILAHLCHHRGQLHAMLVHCVKIDLHVQLFE